MIEVPKRLTPVPETLRQLYLKSGNLCAFPGCAQANMTADGLFVAQICHIEAAEPGGERFNDKMTNESRRAFENLMIMCYPHHVRTNDVSSYTPKVLKDMKKKHEDRFSDPSAAMAKTFIDATLLQQPTMPANISGYEQMVNGLTATQAADSRARLAGFVASFQVIPLPTRHFFSSVVKRMNLVRDTNAVRLEHGDPVAILADDLLDTGGLTKQALESMIDALARYKLAFLNIDENEEPPKAWLQLTPSPMGWSWIELYQFCDFRNLDLDRFAVDMNFALLAK